MTSTNTASAYSGLSLKMTLTETNYVRLSLGFLCWLGGAVHVANLPGYGFWDGVIWLYYVGRYIATHFTQLS